jgi:hypothetical protein
MLRHVSQRFGRAESGQILQLTASCAPGETVVAGGVVPTIAGGVPQDLARIHLLFSGPTGAETWSAAATAVQTLSVSADLTYTVYALCAP